MKPLFHPNCPILQIHMKTDTKSILVLSSHNNYTKLARVLSQMSRDILEKGFKSKQKQEIVLGKCEHHLVILNDW